jgi:hypothetical protein
MFLKEEIKQDFPALRMQLKENIVQFMHPRSKLKQVK